MVSKRIKAGDGVIIGNFVVDIENRKVAVVTFEANSRNVTVHYRKNSVAVCGEVSVDQKDRTDSCSALDIKVGWVNYPPVLGTAGVSEAVEPRFLNSNDIPVFGIGGVQNI